MDEILVDVSRFPASARAKVLKASVRVAIARRSDSGLGNEHGYSGVRDQRSLGS
jgi:hypothetical protein